MFIYGLYKDGTEWGKSSMITTVEALEDGLHNRPMSCVLIWQK